MSAEKALRDAAAKFHEILSAIAADRFLVNFTGPAQMLKALRANHRSPDQLDEIAASGFELCVEALAAMGASDVSIHNCGTNALGENHD
jgi:hypothetical protein